MTTIKFIQVRDDKTPQNLESTLAEQIAKKGLIEIHDELHPNHPTTDVLLTYSIEGDRLNGELTVEAFPESIVLSDDFRNISDKTPNKLTLPIQEFLGNGVRHYDFRFHVEVGGPDDFDLEVQIAGEGISPVKEVIPVRVIYKEAVS